MESVKSEERNGEQKEREEEIRTEKEKDGYIYGNMSQPVYDWKSYFLPINQLLWLFQKLSCCLNGEVNKVPTANPLP